MTDKLVSTPVNKFFHIVTVTSVQIRARLLGMENALRGLASGRWSESLFHDIKGIPFSKETVDMDINFLLEQRRLINAPIYALLDSENGNYFEGLRDKKQMVCLFPETAFISFREVLHAQLLTIPLFGLESVYPLVTAYAEQTEKLFV